MIYNLQKNQLWVTDPEWNTNPRSTISGHMLLPTELSENTTTLNLISSKINMMIIAATGNIHDITSKTPSKTSKTVIYFIALMTLHSKSHKNFKTRDYSQNQFPILSIFIPVISISSTKSKIWILTREKKSMCIERWWEGVEKSLYRSLLSVFTRATVSTGIKKNFNLTARCHKHIQNTHALWQNGFLLLSFSNRRIKGGKNNNNWISYILTIFLTHNSHHQ